jgi:hypothetical protein
MGRVDETKHPCPPSCVSPHTHHWSTSFNESRQKTNHVTLAQSIQHSGSFSRIRSKRQGTENRKRPRDIIRYFVDGDGGWGSHGGA